MAPVYAVPRLLERAGADARRLRLLRDPRGVRLAGAGDARRVGGREFCRERLGLDGPLGSIDREKLNVDGSSLAVGHPFAATGGRILATLAKLLAERGSGRGAHLDLRRRRPGRRGDRRARMSFSLALTPAQHDLVERTHAFAEEVDPARGRPLRPRAGVPVAGPRAGGRGGLLQPALLPRPDRRPDRAVAAAVHGGAVLGLRRDRPDHRHAGARAVGDRRRRRRPSSSCAGRPSASASRATSSSPRWRSPSRRAAATSATCRRPRAATATSG